MAWKLVAAMAAVATMGAEAPPKTMAQPSKVQPYLSDTTAPDTYKILPPAPVAGTTRYEADRTVFLSTRSLKDTPRWSMAQFDANQSGILKGMSCALGVELTAKNAPKTTAMIFRSIRDIGRATNVPKDIYKRQRPYLIDEGPTCVDKTADLAKSPDYPSGHNTWGWSVGLILAELAPDRATEILSRARAFGESRLVCGVHNLSAVEAGRLNASIVVAGLHGSEEFRKDMDVARKEVAAARKAGPAPDPAECAKEAELVAQKLY